MSALPPHLKSKVLEAVKREPSAKRASHRRAVLIVLVAGFVCSVTVLLKIGGIVQGKRPMPYLALSAVGWIVMAGLASWGSVGRGSAMMGRPTKWMWATAVLLAPLMAAWMLLGALGFPSTDPGCPPNIEVGCVLFTVVLGLGPFAAFMYARRRTDPVHPGATGAALGAAAGAWGAVLMNAHCACAAPLHQVLGHVIPVAILGLVGYLLGGPVLTVSAAPSRSPR